VKRAAKSVPAVVEAVDPALAVKALRAQVADAQKRRVIVPCPGCGCAAALVKRHARCSCACEIGLDLRDGEAWCSHCDGVFTRLTTRLRAVCWQRRAFPGARHVDGVVVFEARGNEAQEGETDE